MSEEKARQAAEAVGAFDLRFGKIEIELASAKWMVGLGLALNAAILLKLFTH